MADYVWLAEYNHFACESDFRVIEVCRTREIARQAMKDHKDETLSNFGQERKKNWGEYWRVRRVEVRNG